MIISLVTVVILYVNNEVLKPKLSKICFLPVPIELIAVVSGTLVSRCLDLSTNYNISTIGHIPTGFPGLKSFFNLFLAIFLCFSF